MVDALAAEPSNFAKVASAVIVPLAISAKIAVLICSALHRDLNDIQKLSE